MESEFEKKLKAIKPRKLSREEREFIWMNIENEYERKQESFRYRALAFVGTSILHINVKRFILVPMLIVIFLAGSLSTAFAFADNAVPGDFLFPLDITAEKILLTVSFGGVEDTFRLQFAEERLEEVKALLALATIVEYSEEAGTSTATSTDSTDNEYTDDSTASTATTTTNDSDTTTNEETTSTTNESTQAESGDSSTTTDETVGETEEEFLNNFDFDIADVEGALLFALAHLEESKAVFAKAGNANGVAAMNTFISELINLADNHIAQLDRVYVSIDEGDDEEVKIRVLASSNELKMRFDFVKNTDDDGITSQRVSFRDEDTNTRLKTDDDKVSFRFRFNKKDDDDKDGEDGKDGKNGRNGKNGRGGDDDDDDGKDEKESNKVLVCHKGKNTLSISKNARWAHMLHRDKLGPCEGDDDGKKDTTAPLITSVLADPAITTAEISWVTNEKATSKVWYGTESPVVTASPTLLVTDNDLTEDHSLILTDLIASTTYYFIAVSADESGNSASSTEHSFTTFGEPEPGDTTAPEISNVAAAATTTEATVTWDTNEDANSAVWYSTLSPVDPDTAEKVESGSLVTSHSLNVEGLTASTTYYFIVTSTDGSHNTATSSESSFITTPLPEEPPLDTIPPEISNISADATTTEATITWDTNEDADSTAYFDTVSPVDPDTATKVTIGTLVTSHSLTLQSLTASTTYYYFVTSEDESTNTATSSEESFTTNSLPPADTTAPIISGITPFNIGSTTAEVSWTTDEDANGKLWYSDIDEPIIIADTTAMVSHSDFRTDHTLLLSELVASTTYQFIVVSADEAGNAATSTQEELTTAGE